MSNKEKIEKIREAFKKMKELEGAGRRRKPRDKVVKKTNK